MCCRILLQVKDAQKQLPMQTALHLDVVAAFATALHVDALFLSNWVYQVMNCR